MNKALDKLLDESKSGRRVQLFIPPGFWNLRTLKRVKANGELVVRVMSRDGRWHQVQPAGLFRRIYNYLRGYRASRTA